MLVLDAGSTLGVFDSVGTHELVQVSPLPERVVREEARRILHCAPEATREVLEDFCEAIHVDYDQLPTDWTSTFTAYRYSAQVVGRLIEMTGAPAVVLSNIPCTTGPSRMRSLQAQLPMIEAVYTSYTMGRRKPDRRLWLDITAKHGAQPSETIHVGDQWTNDIRGAIRAGCKALYVHGTRENNTVPPHEDWPSDGTERIWVRRDLTEALTPVREAHEGVPPGTLA